MSHVKRPYHGKTSYNVVVDKTTTHFGGIIMKKSLTEIVFILDRSRSMAGLKSDAIGGFNSMIEKRVARHLSPYSYSPAHHLGSSSSVMTRSLL